MVGILGHVADADDPGRIVRTIVDALPPGSYLAINDSIVTPHNASALETARNEGKPEAALSKIVEGRVTGFFKESVLVEQKYAKDAAISVGTLIEQTGGAVTAFARFRVGA